MKKTQHTCSYLEEGHNAAKIGVSLLTRGKVAAPDPQFFEEPRETVASNLDVFEYTSGPYPNEGCWSDLP
jgi:hypothetical protein